MSTRTVGVVSARLSNSSTMPPLSATNTCPFGAKRTAVGVFRPLQTAEEVKPAGRIGFATAAAS